MMPRALAMMALALTMAGCATGDESELYTGSTRPLAPTLEADVPSEYAVAYLPQVAGAVEAVRQSSRTDHVFQSVLYPNKGYGDGENRLTVSIGPPSSGSSYFQAPTQRQIASEMRTVLPGVAMRITSAVGQNAQGPFGYALGNTTNGTCIFAWQTAKDVGRIPATGFGRLTRRHYAAKVRLRYCHPNMTESSLVALMAGLRVRKITPTTLEMLRFAEGAGVATRAFPVARQSAPVASRPVGAKGADPAKAKSRAENRSKSPRAAHVSPPVRTAPRVLKPGELAAYKRAQDAAKPKAASLRPVRVTAKSPPPLPATTRDSAQRTASKPRPARAAAVPLPADLKG